MDADKKYKRTPIVKGAIEKITHASLEKRLKSILKSKAIDEKKERKQARIYLGSDSRYGRQRYTIGRN